MVEAKTILFIDNDEKYLKNYTKLLERKGYRVLRANTLQIAEQYLNSHHLHLMIVDIRMESDDDPKDISGLVFARKIEYQHLPKIILTGYPSYEYARDALDPSFGNLPPAVDFVAKDEGVEKIIQAVDKAFREKVHINWELEIHLPSEAPTFPQIASQIEPSLNVEQVGERCAEIEDLFRDLFYSYKEIVISRMLWCKGSRVALEVLAYKPLEAHATEVDQWTEDDYIVTCGLKPEVTREQEKFHAYKPKSFTEIDLVDSAETFRYAGSAWDFRQADLEESLFLKDYLLKEKTDKQIKSSIEKLYKKLKLWQVQGYLVKPLKTLAQLWQELTGAVFDLRRDEWQTWIEDLARDALWRKIVTMEIASEQIDCYLTKTAVVSFPNPTRLIFTEQDLSFPKWITGVTLGGLDADTVLVGPDEELWFTDFVNLRNAPLYLDFVSLETCTRFDLLESNNLSSIHQFEKQLLGMRSLHEGVSGSVEPDCKRAFNIIQFIRQAAAEVIGEELEPYYWCLLVFTLKDLFTLNPAVRRSRGEIIAQLHRLMVSAMIAEKLRGMGSAQGNHSQDTPVVGIRIVEGAYEVIVDGRQVELTNTEYDLLLYLHERAGLLCERGDIISDVFDVKDAYRESEYRRLTTHMGRLRKKIEIDTGNPVYLQTVRGKGYKLVLPDDAPLG